MINKINTMINTNQHNTQINISDIVVVQYNKQLLLFNIHYVVVLVNGLVWSC